MCGIAGVLDKLNPITEQQLIRFTDSLTHRGPDGRGIFINGEVGLGHRRLSILDLSENGRNPMPYGGEDGQRYWITYNGEVYNFLELRRELETRGCRFRTDTDTEVVLAAYAEWGIDCLQRFNGMWAFAIWDSVERQLFLARDRFGIKPLYFWINGPRIAFASEMKAFLALDGFTPALDPEIARLSLTGAQAIEGSRSETIMAGVRRLLPGHALTIAFNGSIVQSHWWDTRANLPTVPARYEDQVAQFQSLFFDSVRLRLRSDVPVGVCLSGGVDSSAVLSSMAWLHRQNAGMERTPDNWKQAFIASFPDTVIDERRFADQVAEHTGVNRHYWTFTDQEALDNLLNSVWSMEDVYPGIAVPVWCLYREMRRHNTVVSIDGHGGDELLGGYTGYLDAPMFQLNDYLYRDFHQTLLPSILRNYDRCSMAHGIEVRMPFMDWRLVCFTTALAGEAKIGGGYTKRILRDAMAGIMPEAIRLRRAKIGFNSPMVEWYNGGMSTLLHKAVSHPLWLDSPLWDGPGFRDYILNKTDNRAWKTEDWGITLSVWSMVNILLWQLLFVERRAPGPAFFD